MKQEVTTPKPSLFQRLFNWIAQPHVVYAVAALVVGMSFIAITPPFHGPDEDAHFLRAYQLATGKLKLVTAQQPGRLGAELPSAVPDMVEQTVRDNPIRGYPSKKYNHWHTKAELKNTIDTPQERRSVWVDTTNTYVYNPVLYLPAAAAIAAVHWLGGSPLVALYAARVVSLVAIVMLFAVAVRLAPRRKWAFAAVLLVPMLLFQNAVVSVDGLSFAVTALFASYVMRLREQRTVHKGQWLLLALAAVALAIVKLPLVLAAALAFTLIRGRRHILPVISIVVVALAVFAGQYMLLNRLHPTVRMNGPSEANQQVQIDKLVHDPFEFLRVTHNTYMNQFGDGQTVGVLGVFGTADTTLPMWLYGVLLLVLGLLVCTGAEKTRPLRMWQTIGLLIIGATYFMAVNGAMYLTYTPTSFSTFYGVQGRYFLPLLIVLPLYMSPLLHISPQQEHKRNRVLIGVLLCAIAVVLFIVFQRYYLYTP